MTSSWSEQFIGMFESLGMGAQFQRGRRYARGGHVVQLTISSSLVVALVRDEGEQTYRVRIALRAFTAGEWAVIERELAGQAFYAAKLLAGQLPADLDQLLARSGLKLFPDSIGDVALDCSCPDWQVPCRHLAAACYVLAESFDTDPFGILAWRGRGREELLDRLRVLRPPTADAQAAGGQGRGGPGPSGQPAAALADCLDSYWSRLGEPAPSTVPPDVPGSVRRLDALLDQLDPLPLTVDGQAVTELLRPAYRALDPALDPLTW